MANSLLESAQKLPLLPGSTIVLGCKKSLEAISRFRPVYKGASVSCDTFDSPSSLVAFHRVKTISLFSCSIDNDGAQVLCRWYAYRCLRRQIWTRPNEKLSEAGNFKMNGTLESLKALVSSLDDAKLDPNTGK